MTTDHTHREALIARLLGPPGPQVTCEECFELLDEYVDREAAGDDPAARLPGMRVHLQGCPACHEDYESLRDLVLAEGPATRAAAPSRPRRST